MSNFINSISNDDIEKIGLKIIRKSSDKNAYFIQICDSERLFDDGTYACHYEILHMREDDLKNVNHRKDKVYVEIHFEEKCISKHFKLLVKSLIEYDNSLEEFSWRRYCPGLRLKNSEFTVNNKQDVLENLKQLKEKTIESLLNKYIEINFFVNWGSYFSVDDISKKKVAKSRISSIYISEPREIFIIHEKIKAELIEKIKNNKYILGKKYEIDTNFLSEEHEVNKINYIDLVAKAKNQGKEEIIIFFEIKTSPDARLCIRQALGQLMEYSYYPSTDNAQLLVVVGTGEKDSNIKKYIKNLKDKFNVPIDYLQVKV